MVIQEKVIDYTKKIDCAAILAPDGRVWTGKRHHHCIATIIQATGASRVGAGYIQGFVTMSKDFVDRETAARYAFESDQITGPKTELFSEDLY